MELLFRNADGNLPDRHRDYAAKKLGRLDRYLSKASRVELVHTETRGRHKVSVTVFADGLTIRGEETDESIRAAIDKLDNKLERRLAKLKGRLVKKHRKLKMPLPVELEMVPEHPEEEAPFKEFRTYSMKPMDPDEALLQMELMDVPFMPYINSENKQVEVIYRRRGGGYGLVHPG